MANEGRQIARELGRKIAFGTMRESNLAHIEGPQARDMCQIGLELCPKCYFPTKLPCYLSPRDLPSPIDCLYPKSLSATYDLDFCSAILAHFSPADTSLFLSVIGQFCCRHRKINFFFIFYFQKFRNSTYSIYTIDILGKFLDLE